MTRQISDYLLYNGQEYHLEEWILEQYFKKFPERKPESHWMSTALYRGYVAHFVIRNIELLFIKVSVAMQDGPEYISGTDIFGKGDKYQAFTGFIRIDDYREFHYDEQNKNAIYEFLEIRNGDMVKHWKLNYDEFMVFKEILFEEYKSSPKFDEGIAHWKENNPMMKASEIETKLLENIMWWINR